MGWQHWIDGQRALHPDWPEEEIRKQVEEWWPGLPEEDRYRDLNASDVRRWLRKAGVVEANEPPQQLGLFGEEVKP